MDPHAVSVTPIMPLQLQLTLVKNILRHPNRNDDPTLRAAVEKFERLIVKVCEMERAYDEIVADAREEERLRHPPAGVVVDLRRPTSGRPA